MNKIILLAAISFLVLSGCGSQRLLREEPDNPVILSFEDCVAAGNPVMESYPRRCNASGKTFTERVTDLPEKWTVCTFEQRKAEACGEIYLPVCAEVPTQCAKAPCDTVKQTFSNPCEACRNERVKAYMSGECEGGKSENCPATCPVFAPPPPDWCQNGKILPPIKDDCGCLGPGRCEKN
jgi:hypothetical protein